MDVLPRLEQGFRFMLQILLLWLRSNSAYLFFAGIFTHESDEQFTAREHVQTTF